MNARKEPVRQRLIRGVGSGSKDQTMLSSYLGVERDSRQARQISYNYRDRLLHVLAIDNNN